jgi:hypothetical protein
MLFANLGLVVVDEEQRFGVDVKERLKALRASVDVLTRPPSCPSTPTPSPTRTNSWRASARSWNWADAVSHMRLTPHAVQNPDSFAVASARAIQAPDGSPGVWTCDVINRSPRIPTMEDLRRLNATGGQASDRRVTGGHTAGWGPEHGSTRRRSIGRAILSFRRPGRCRCRRDRCAIATAHG